MFNVAFVGRVDYDEFGRRGCSLIFERGSVPIFGFRNVPLNSYLGCVDDSVDRNSMFRVHKSEERKNRAVWCDS